MQFLILNPPSVEERHETLVMALSSLDQHYPFARKSHISRTSSNALALEVSLFDRDRTEEPRLFANDFGINDFNEKVEMNPCVISLADGRSNFVWCHLQANNLSVGGQFLKQLESVEDSSCEWRCSDFHRSDCDFQVICISRDELSDFGSWVEMLLEIANQAKYGESLSVRFYQSLSTALYKSWEFFGGDVGVDALGIQHNKTLIQRLEALSLDEHCCDAFKDFYAAQSESGRFELSVGLRQAVMNILAFNILADGSALAFEKKALPSVIVSKMNRLLQQNLLILKESSIGRLLLEAAMYVAAIVSQGMFIENDESGSQLCVDQVKLQCISAFESGSSRGDLDALRVPFCDHQMNSLIPHFKALEEMMDQMTFCSDAAHQNESLLLESQPQEWQGVVISYNRLAERIQQACTQQQLFMRSVSHELMTPLALISATAHRLGDRLKDVPDSDLQLMHLLENEACKADRLVRDLMDLSLCESGRLNLSLQTISALDVLKEMFNQLDLLPWGSRVQHDQPQDLDQLNDVSLLIHPERLIQCLVNVLENAAKYSPEASVIHLSQGTSSECFYCEIKDHGPGISIEDQANIFKPFYRGTQHSPSVPGSGVGLALVAQLVDLMNGRVAVAESSASGTVLRLEFPVVR